MAATDTTWELVAVHDVRPLDWDTGKRVDIPEDALPECSRCGKRHAKVYTVSNDRGDVLTVGSGCWKRVVFDHSIEIPESEIRRARKAARERDRAQLAAARLQRAHDLAAELRAMGDPGFTVTGFEDWGSMEGTPDRTARWTSRDGITIDRHTHDRLPTYGAPQWRECDPDVVRADLLYRWYTHHAREALGGWGSGHAAIAYTAAAIAAGCRSEYRLDY